jgi:hypothetical protein
VVDSLFLRNGSGVIFSQGTVPGGIGIDPALQAVALPGKMCGQSGVPGGASINSTL